MSYVGTHPTGRKFYVEAKRRMALAFVVFVHHRPTPSHPLVRDRWERVAIVENRPYEGERHRVNGSYVPYDGAMPPGTKAEVTAEWWRSIGGCAAEDVAIVELRPAHEIGSRRRA